MKEVERCSELNSWRVGEEGDLAQCLKVRA